MIVLNDRVHVAVTEAMKRRLDDLARRYDLSQPNLYRFALACGIEHLEKGITLGEPPNGKGGDHAAK